MPKSFEVHAEAIAETEQALLVEIDDEQYWVPQSQILEESEVWKNGDEGLLVITEWLAKQKDLL